MLRRVIFDRERVYAALKIGSWKLPKCEESPFGLSVNKTRASGLFFGTGGEALQNRE
jgi:hypothetical protein